MEKNPTRSDGARACSSESDVSDTSAGSSAHYSRGMSQECLESSASNPQEYETQLLGFTPKAFCDGTHNAILEYLRQYIDAAVNTIQSEFADLVSKERAEKAANAILLKTQKTLGSTFDKLETYLLTSIFHIPDHVVLPEDAVQESYSFTKQDEELVDKELEELKQKILAEKYYEAMMREELEQTALVQASYDDFLTQLEDMGRTGGMTGVSDVKESILFANATADKLCELLEKDRQSTLPDLHQRANAEKEVNEASKKIKLVHLQGASLIPMLICAFKMPDIQ